MNQPPFIGIDFGTSNSCAAYNDGNKTYLIPLSESRPETRTTLFWDNEEKMAFVWSDWIARFLDWSPWRLIQSPKSYLNSKDDVKTVFGAKERSLTDIIGIILSDFRQRTNNLIGEDIKAVRLGRPVHFHDEDPRLDKLAQDRLEKAARMAWFEQVSFEFEPIAAARTFEYLDDLGDKLLLVGDFWWGTSDFSLIKFGDWKMRVIWNDGAYVAWDSFDKSLSLGFFSRFLWKGGSIRRMGNRWELEMPPWPYIMLSDWKQIHEFSKRKTLNQLHELIGVSVGTEVRRLLEIAEDPSLWYEYFKLVENSKIRFSDRNADQVMGKTIFFRDAFEFILERSLFTSLIAEDLRKIRIALENLLQDQQITPDQIGKILLVGWTGKMPHIQDLLTSIVGEWKIIEGDTFNAIGMWLAKGNTWKSPL